MNLFTAAHNRFSSAIQPDFHLFFSLPPTLSFKLCSMNDTFRSGETITRAHDATRAPKPGMSTHAARRSSRRGRARVWFSALLLVPCLFGGMMLFLDSFGQRDQSTLAHGGATRNKASAIVVLGAAVNAGGVPGSSLRARTLHAVALYHRGVAPFLIFTGGVGTWAPAESQAAALLAQRHGVPASAILREETSTSTWQNIAQATRICRAHGWSRVVVVSDPYHLWRARRNFACFGIQAFPSPCPNPAPTERIRMAAREVLSVTRDFLAGR